MILDFDPQYLRLIAKIARGFRKREYNRLPKLKRIFRKMEKEKLNCTKKIPLEYFPEGFLSC